MCDRESFVVKVDDTALKHLDNSKIKVKAVWNVIKTY